MVFRTLKEHYRLEMEANMQMKPHSGSHSNSDQHHSARYQNSGGAPETGRELLLSANDQSIQGIPRVT